MAGNTFIAVPNNVEDPMALKRFLEAMIARLDSVLGFRGDSDLRLTANPEQDAIGLLDQTISATPTQAEVQAISDKLDALLAALVEANIISED